MKRLLLALAAVLILGPLEAHAILIGSADFQFIGRSPTSFNSGDLYLGYEIDGDPSTFENELFNVTIDGSSVGQTATADASSANFASFVTLLTNGVDDPLHSAWLPEGTLFGSSHSYSFESAAFGTMPDFAGYSIDRFVLTVTAADLTTDGGSTEYETGFRVEVFNESTAVPTPGVLALLLSGGLGLALSGRRRTARA